MINYEFTAKRTYLTGEDQKRLDPSGKAREQIKRLFAHEDSIPGQVAPFLKHPEMDFLGRYQEILQKQKFAKQTQIYLQYNHDHASKVGRQGGLPASKDICEAIDGYYSTVKTKPPFSSWLYVGRDYLIRLIRQRIDQVGYPSLSCHRGVDNTAASLPTMGRKGEYMAETVGFKPWRHMLPLLPWYRDMRQKTRVIFEDPTANVRYIEQQLSAVRIWLRENLSEYFGGWINPAAHHGVREFMTDLVDNRQFSVEGDYIKMDQHFSIFVVTELILPIYEILLPDCYLSFASAVEELFKAPLYLGSFILEGLHTLFSGIGPTNDFETIYTVILYFANALKFDCIENSSVIAIGDDFTIKLKRCTERFPFYLADSIKDISDSAYMELHPFSKDGKSRVEQGHSRFCRHVYYPRGPRDLEGKLGGAYPTLLCLNSLFFTERPQFSPGIAASSVLQRLDGCLYSPDYKLLCDFARKQFSLEFTRESLSELPKDWWERLYNEKWTPDSSPTFKYFNPGI